MTFEANISQQVGELRDKITALEKKLLKGMELSLTQATVIKDMKKLIHRNADRIGRQRIDIKRLDLALQQVIHLNERLSKLEKPSKWKKWLKIK